MLCSQLQSERIHIIIGRKKFHFLTFLSQFSQESSGFMRFGRDEGKDFVVTERTKVCSLHFRPEDLRKSLNGRVYVREDAIPSKFDWSGPSPKKRKAPTERKPLLTKKKLLNDDCFETEEIFSMEAIETQPSTSTDKASEEPTAAEIIITQ